MTISDGTRRIQTSFFIPNLREYITKYLDLEPLSRTLREEENLGERGKMRVGER
jgi:hypothetical protein